MLFQNIGLSQENNEVRGLMVGIDISRYALLFFDPGFMKNEVTLDLRINKNRLIVANIGMISGSREESTYNLDASGVYARLGIDRNFLNHQDDLLTIGTRISTALFSYNPSGIIFNDPFWGTATSEIPGQNMFAVWGEVVFGIRAMVFSNFFLGWSASARVMFRKPRSDYFPSPKVPGYGSLEGSVSPGFQFYLSYRFPFHRKLT